MIINNIKEKLIDIIYPVTSYSTKKPFKDYKIEVENQYFAVYKPQKERIVAANDTVVCTQLVNNKNVLFLYPDAQRCGHKLKINFNSTVFPDLISGSTIQMVLLVPYITKDDNRNEKWKLVVVTDKCQVYHNFPDKCKSSRQAMITFAESMIWDLPGNRYPVKDVNCEEYEYYYPFLPDTVYEYHPANKSPRYYEVTGKDGQLEKLSRFYFPKRGKFNNSFSYMDGYEPDPLLTFIGSYAGNNTSADATRIVIFATHDGGQNWFAKYEFNDDGRSENYGNSLRNYSTEFVAQYIHKREFVASESGTLNVKIGEQIKIKEIRQADTIEIVSKREHGLKSGNIIALKGNSENVAQKALLNNEFNDNNFGNGVFYKVKVIDETTIKIYECVSKSKTNLPARHIHSINRVKDGFLVATGETYPQGWLMMFSVTDADNWSNNLAHNKIPVTLLNTSRESVQRIVGAVFLEKCNERELIYASDCSSMNIDETEIRDGILTNSMGIYKGKLSDINDFHKFELLEEVKEPSFFFKELDGCYVYCGQRGELAVGFEKGKYWRHARVESALVHYMGRTLNYFVIDGNLLLLK